MSNTITLAGTDTNGNTYALSGPVTPPAPPPPVVTPPPAIPPAPGVNVPQTLPNGNITPGLTNSGVPAGTTLTPSTLTTITESVSGLSFTNNIQVSAPNVTISNCSFDFPNLTAAQGANFGILVNASANNFTLENCTLTGGSPGYQIVCQNAPNATYKANQFFNTPTTPFYIGGGGNTVIEGNWVQPTTGWNGQGTSNVGKLNWTGGDHTDVIFGMNFANLSVTGNNFDCRGNAPMIAGVSYNISSFAILIQPYETGMSTGALTVESNYICGGGFCLAFMGSTTGNSQIINNVFGPNEGYQPPYVYSNYIAGSGTWSGNVTSAGAAVPLPSFMPATWKN